MSDKNNAPDTTASASGEKRYCSVCGVVEGGYHQGECLYIGVVTAAECRAAQPVQAGEAVDEHEQAIDLMRKLERDGLEFVCMDGSANVVGIIKAAWKYRASLAPVSAQPELTVWEGPMPESNGRQNYTAVLHRKGVTGLDLFTDGYQFTRSEYPDRTRYEADFMRWLLGERAERPELWDDCYDMDKHSGYVAPVSAQQGAAEANAKALDARYREGYGDGWKEGRADLAAKAPAAPECQHCGRAPGERRDECEECPAASPASAPEVTQTNEQKGGAK